MPLKRIPVTIISGFLGAGKTTLVNRLLAESSSPSERIGVIVNEFGEVGIDGDLIVADENPLVEITNGCICCTVRRDLSTAVVDLLSRPAAAVTRLLIETSGLADPAPVLQTFLADPAILELVQLESVVTVVDAAHVLAHIEDDIVREQIVFADTLVLNKVELLEARELASLQNELKRLNPAAVVMPASHARVDVEQVMGHPRFSLANVLVAEPGLLTDGEHDHEHDASITSVSARVDGPLDAVLFNRWINQLVMRDGANLMRTKGVLSFEGEARRFHVHSVHMLLDSTPGPRWAAIEPRHSRMVFIGRGLDEQALRDGLAACAYRDVAIPA